MVHNHKVIQLVVQQRKGYSTNGPESYKLFNWWSLITKVIKLEIRTVIQLVVQNHKRHSARGAYVIHMFDEYLRYNVSI